MSILEEDYFDLVAAPERRGIQLNLENCSKNPIVIFQT